ncbi:PilW family protein [Oceanicoccus sp. KOV_DT_Chl]|uniref:PilW family protein n=1 Tax=Oceanicoccus sp. KOV_DT_Chl TaxID=1904639 RepID=UPI000C7B3380|nr:PilW family protein [Oceanicoccus sp. KOV_DT_Chl]
MNNPKTTFQRQQGLSLIELMVSIAIAAAMMSAALQFVVSTRQTYELNDDISRIQENGRMAMDILMQDVRMAGARMPSAGDGKVPDFFLIDCTGISPCASNNYTVGASQPDTNLLADGSDRLSVEYDPPGDNPRPGTDDTITTQQETCLGTAITATENIIANVYTVEDLDNDGISSLYCQGWDTTAGAWLDDAPQPLVDGIDHMQVLYGVAGDTSQPDSVTMYIPAQKVFIDNPDPTPDVNLWSQVKSARISLLVSNGMVAGTAENKQRQYRLLDGDLLTVTDGQPRRIYTATVQFNNSEF